MTEAMESSKTALAAIALGIAESAFEASVKYAKQRKQFGQSISRFQAIQFKIAEMATQLECGRMIIHGTAMKQDDGRKCPAEAAMTKYYCSKMVMGVSSTALQIFGGYGYMKDFPLERYMRDARLFSIAEGTNEIQKLIIAAKTLDQIK
jgi:alkylation response protein AidB-like acyl-CoA dehydrogenase